MAEKIKVGYIGLGNIGKPSASRLIGEHFSVHVYDHITSASCGLTMSPSSFDLAKRATRSCLAASGQVRALAARDLIDSLL